MASFEIAIQHIKRTQGLYPYYSDNKRLQGEQILCSECFQDEGLRLDAFRIGIESDKKCSKCSSEKGRKLTKQIVRELCYRFFVRGSVKRFKYGGVPLIQMNEERFNNSEIKVGPSLVEDVNLIEQAGEIGLFYYSPRLWMLGEIEPLKNLQKEEEINKIIDRILQIYPKHLLNNQHPFYRLRVNPKIPHEYSQYDSPPAELKKSGRLNWNGEPILYGSPDLELCIHECRASIEDELYVAKLVPSQPLKMINLAALVVEERVDEFTSLDLAMHFLFLAGTHSYPICSQISERIKSEGFDGIIYPSYFSNTRTGAVPFETILGISTRYLPPLKDYVQSQTAPNIALFGQPIEEGKLSVHSINKVIINSLKYDLSFGPSYNGTSIESMKEEEFINRRYQEEISKVLKAFRTDANE